MISASDIQSYSTSPPHTTNTTYTTATSVSHHPNSDFPSPGIVSPSPPNTRDNTTIMSDSGMISMTPSSPNTSTMLPVVDRIHVPTDSYNQVVVALEHESFTEPMMARSAEEQQQQQSQAYRHVEINSNTATIAPVLNSPSSVTTIISPSTDIEPLTTTPAVNNNNNNNLTKPIDVKTPSEGISSGTGIAERLGRRILVVATDDSTASQAALTWTLKQLVHPERDHLIVLTVAQYKIAGLISTNELKTAKRELKAEEKAQHVVDYAATHIGQWKQTMTVPLSFELVTLKAANADVRDIICEYSADIGASMLIVGAHSSGAVKRVILGSTATYCLHHATVPVIVVKEGGTITAA